MSTEKRKRGLVSPSGMASSEGDSVPEVQNGVSGGKDRKGKKGLGGHVTPSKKNAKRENGVGKTHATLQGGEKGEQQTTVEPVEAEGVVKSLKKRKRGGEPVEKKEEERLGVSEKSLQNKEKVLVLSSRGIVHRFRHLMVDLMTLLPHSKKDVKLDTKDTLSAVNEVADLKGCSSSVFFECRKRKDCYMWIAKTPAGPSAKFLVNAVHTMAELKLTGNHLKGSRPLLTFSPNFDGSPHLQLLKELFTQVFSTPKGHRKVKPFFDHVFSFSFLDNHIWFRNYQITVPAGVLGKLEKGALEKMSLVEVGPRFCMNPIKIFSGSFSGVTLYQNPFYVSPNVLRADEKRAKSGKYVQKVKAKQRRKQHMVRNPHVPDELEDVWRTQFSHR